jgi:hypothetical protein
MIGQCIFCSWYGIRLRRARYLDRGGRYHPHCVRVALNSPDPADRSRAEAIVKAEMPRLMRERFWEINPPNRTVNPALGVRDLGRHDLEQLCREQRFGGAERVASVLADAPPAADRREPGPSPRPGPRILEQIGYESDADERVAARLRQLTRSAPAAGPEAEDPPALPDAARSRPVRAPKTNVDRAVELVSRFSDEEMGELRERLARLVTLFALPQAAAY